MVASGSERTLGGEHVVTEVRISQPELEIGHPSVMIIEFFFQCYESFCLQLEYPEGTDPQPEEIIEMAQSYVGEWVRIFIESDGVASIRRLPRGWQGTDQE